MPGSQGTSWSRQTPSSKPRGPNWATCRGPRHVAAIIKELSWVSSHIPCVGSETSPPWTMCLTPLPAHHPRSLSNPHLEGTYALDTVWVVL